MTHTVRRVVVVTGVVVLAIGLRGIITDRFLTHPVNWALFFLGGALAHDLLLAPAVAVLGTLARHVPAGVRPPVLGGMVVSGLLTAVALPVVLGLGKRADNPSQLPLDYHRNLLLLLALVWAVVGLLVLHRLVKSRH